MNAAGAKQEKLSNLSGKKVKQEKSLWTNSEKTTNISASIYDPRRCERAQARRDNPGLHVPNGACVLPAEIGEKGSVLKKYIAIYDR